MKNVLMFLKNIKIDLSNATAIQLLETVYIQNYSSQELKEISAFYCSLQAYSQ